MPSARGRPLISLAAIVVVLVAAWFVAAELQLVDPLFLPGPCEVLATARTAPAAKATGRSRCGNTCW